MLIGIHMLTFRVCSKLTAITFCSTSMLIGNHMLTFNFGCKMTGYKILMY